ncbi:MAG: exodeoxyribonuclease VII large subunit [Lachnospiraceae bacterium]
MKQSIYSVRQVNAYVKNMFDQDFLLCRIRVRGEVSNCRYHTSGHIYFTLKDGAAALAAVMFAGNRGGLPFLLTDGQQVVVTGYVNIYERDGKYQLYARAIEKEGTGDLYERFEALKRELSERGLFAEEYKQPIPKMIRTLGVVTAQTGAAVRDIINITRRRNPYVQIILYPAKVQGDGAARTIVRGIGALEAYGADCIIVGRGGGSIEDLWAFNEETVAQAIFDCSVPVISAVGHETDFTIADFAADLRAPTPSAAAELAVYEYRAFSETLKDCERRLSDAMGRKLTMARLQLDQRKLRLEKFRPEHQIAAGRQTLDHLEDRLRAAMKGMLSRQENRLALYAQRLKGCSPLERITKGYAFVTKENGTRLQSVSEVQNGEKLVLRLADGTVHAAVTAVYKEEEHE